MEIKITRHAYKRAKERFQWKKSVLKKMSTLAMREGMSHGDTRGQLNLFITKLYKERRTANNIKIYGQDLFLFSGNTLITVYRVPNEYLGHIKNHNNG